MELYDVLGVNLGGREGPQYSVRFMAQGKTLQNAEAIVRMAVYRRGVEEEFFVEVPTGSYNEGEIWTGQKGER